ncbi:MAG TPA: HEAT repeat domain-containing protein, partial [Gemmataceae bacterium]|nr:HEAT repeat domain-containing protein [Gemmataceae bacterium]
NLVLAKDERQRQLGEKYRDTKGVQYTQAMALAIAKLSGKSRRDMRDALVERMVGMTEETLAGYLEDENSVIRRGAVLALASRESTTYTDKVVDLLRDPEPTVVRAVHAALCSLSAEDFGPSIGPTEEELDLAIGNWRNWWKKKSESP